MQKGIEDIVAFAADPEGGLRELARFEEAYATAAGKAFPWSADGSENLVRIFGMSRALTSRLLSNPLWAHEIALTPYSSQRKPADVMGRELASTIAEGEEGDGPFMRSIRRYKYREMIRIVARDITGTCEVAGLLAEWSDVADAILSAAWRHSHEAMIARHGEPGDAGAGCAIALGKLGGCELNLSSDVDLIMIYGSDEGGAGQLTCHEFFVAKTALFTRLLSEVTEDGFAFRVDHELRPEGPQGPLANSLDAAERYYEYFGHDWERQALIRARVVAGDAELGRRFIDAVKPFVYRKSISLADIAHMRRMKREMERASERRGGAFDVKHGRGGIREVEFITQAFGLLFGGGIESIRTGNTFEAIEALARESLIHPFGARTLTRAYSFLRRTENMLQAASDLQVHRLPADERGMAELARRMGYTADGAARLRADLEGHRKAVGKFFDALFTADYERQELMEAIRDNAARAENKEEEIESLAWFRVQETRRIQELDLTRGMPIAKVMERLTLAAEAVLVCAWEICSKHLEARYGVPRLEGGGHAGFAIVGLGSLGSREVDYGSDLDLCFIHAGRGETDGATRISNVEFFTKLAQRIISTISLPGRYGFAYKVDSELRPSGRAGTLVATLDSFINYHRKDAELWERRSLMKARPIAGDPDFLGRVSDAIGQLAFSAPSPSPGEIKAEIARLRERTIEERATHRASTYEIKIGRGGLADVEAVIHLHQLISAPEHAELHEQNTMEVLDALGTAGLIADQLHDKLTGHLEFLRRLISRVRLATGRAAEIFSSTAPYADTVAEGMGCADAAELASLIERHMSGARTIFEREIGAAGAGSHEGA